MSTAIMIMVQPGHELNEQGLRRVEETARDSFPDCRVETCRIDLPGDDGGPFAEFRLVIQVPEQLVKGTVRDMSLVPADPKPHRARCDC